MQCSTTQAVYTDHYIIKLRANLFIIVCERDLTMDTLLHAWRMALVTLDTIVTKFNVKNSERVDRCACRTI